MKKMRAAVVGVGYLGRFHAQKYKALPQVELVGVFDANISRAEEVAAELQVAVIRELKDLVGQVDAVTVAATTSAHFEICKFLLENNIHVNVEKPITSNSSEGQILCDLAKKNKLHLQVGHVERFNPALIAAQEKLKTPLFIECHRLAPFKPRGVDVNVVLDLMIHDLDMILHLVPSEPIRVDAIGTPVITKTADIANARIEFASGAVANVTSSRVSLTAQRKFRVFQDSQYLSLDFGSGEVRLMSKTGDWVENAPPPIESEVWNLEKSDALLAETSAFVDSVMNNKPCVVTGEDGMKALRLAEQIIGAIDKR
ncbi:MAG: Gfo/Idh/MocA family oxidoreductase [Bdellovibrionales bacterium]|nr:Gfo/Idh/MocA family oxidoreductase [Bdellovibrionales bacterium]